MEEPKIIYSSYTEAQKRATAKYREANKEKVNAQRKKYYESRKEKDPDFLQYKRDKAREYYLKKKNSKNEDLSHLIPQLNEAVKILQTEGDSTDSGHYPLPLTRDKEYLINKENVAKLEVPEARNYIELVKIDEPEEEHQETIEEHWHKKAIARDQEPEEEKPPLAWSQIEVKPVKKERKPRVSKKAKSESDVVELVELEKKPNLTLDDLNTLLLSDIKEPKTPRTRKSKKETKDILMSA